MLGFMTAFADNPIPAVGDDRRPLAVIGAGPAGLMAAGTAAGVTRPVWIFERNNAPGLKLNLTGQGRCNCTNAAVLPAFLAHCHPDRARSWLKTVLRRFSPAETIAFLQKIGIPTGEEDQGRIFPIGRSAKAVTAALVNWCRSRGVRIRYGHRVMAIQYDATGGIQNLLVRTPQHDRPAAVPVHGVIIATGGCSYPGTGATGDGYTLARSCGHTVNGPVPALVRLICRDPDLHECAGVSLPEAAIDLWADGKKAARRQGELLFTHTGLSGPAALSMSREVSRRRAHQQAFSLTVDMIPHLDDGRLDMELVRLLNAHGKKQLASMLKYLVPARVAGMIVVRCRIDPDRRCHQVGAADRKLVRTQFKRLAITDPDSGAFDEAMITAGGVALREVDPVTCRSRIVSNLSFAGEVLDCDADTGGYNLQIAFSTGYCAGNAWKHSI
jgi:predicted Rossmann fold flavoprotein